MSRNAYLRIIAWAVPVALAVWVFTAFVLPEDHASAAGQRYFRVDSGSLVELDEPGQDTYWVRTKSGDLIRIEDPTASDLLEPISAAVGGLDKLDVVVSEDVVASESEPPPARKAALRVSATSFDNPSPNPGNPTVTLHYTIGEGEALHVTLHIYDVLGQVVRDLVDEVQGAGEHMIVWDGIDNDGNASATGTYLATLAAGDFKASKKLTIAK